MKTKNKFRYVSIIMALLLILITIEPTRSLAAVQPTVNLRSTESFAVLAGSTITNTGTTTINGDAGANIGLSPGSAFTGQASVSVSGGSIYIADSTAVQAQVDLGLAYLDAMDPLRGAATTIPSELGGTTLKPGIYDSADGKFYITGTLTLDAENDPEGVFIFRTASTLVTADGSMVSLINGARYCRTFWAVGSSATLGVNSTFVGHIFAEASITATTGAFIQGQLLAKLAVTLDSNTITNGACDVIHIPTATPTSTPTNTIVTPTVTPTVTPIATPTVTPIATPTVTPIATPTVTPTPTSIPTVSSTPNVPTEVVVVPELPEEVNAPKTGSFPTEVLFGMGTLLTGTVLFIKRKKH